MFFAVGYFARHAALPAVILLAAAAASAHGPDPAAPAGEPGEAVSVSREIVVTMADEMRFLPPHIMARSGETVRCVVRNDDAIPHEFMLGEIAALQRHAHQMQSHPDMQHDEANAITLQPGETGELVWRFTHAGSVDFACLIPGHFEAGMKGSIWVSP